MTSLQNPGRPLRIVHITAGVPVETVQHAGGVLQRDVTISLQNQGHQIIVLAPINKGNLRDVGNSIVECTYLCEDWPARWSPVGIVIRAAHKLNQRAHRAPIALSHPPFVAALLLQPRVWRILRRADVIDLQWFAQIQLQPLIRLIAGRRPQIVGTFHDVISQRLERTADFVDDADQRSAAAAAVKRARRRERRMGRRLERSIVLSSKDRDLLIASGVPVDRVRVLPPKFSRPAKRVGDEPTRRSDTALLVGYFARHENVDAALWMLRDIWPRVLRRVPGSRLRLVGAGAPQELVSEAESIEGVELLGFVDDLWSQYAEASCTVVPLRDGAGVKFKTLEALLAGAPTIATPIGAEGVGEESDFVVISEDAQELADGIADALTDRSHAERAAATADRLAHRHGEETFDSAVRSAYTLNGSEPLD